MQTKEPAKPAFPLAMLLALASALGVAVAVALAGVAMLLAAPAYADEASLLLERRGVLAEAIHAQCSLSAPRRCVRPCLSSWNTGGEASGACWPLARCCLPS